MGERKKPTGFRRSKPGGSLGDLHPELVKQWDQNFNDGLTPFDVVPHTHRKIWWRCDAGPDHVWPTTGNGRVMGQGCPSCAGSKVSVTNSLETMPELVAQWHPTLNGALTPDVLTCGSAEKAWWRCHESPEHVWDAAVSWRKRSGCPFCAGIRVCPSNSLASVPELAAQWHPTLNGDLTPADVVVGTARKIWWKCNGGEDHVWRAPGSARLEGKSCPFCAARGYDLTKPGAFYLLCGDEWGKVGVSNVLEKRLKTHEANGVFGSLVLSVLCDDGTVPAQLERNLKSFIAGRTDVRAPKADGFTESFPARLLGDVHGEVLRLAGDVTVPVTVIGSGCDLPQ